MALALEAGDLVDQKYRIVRFIGRGAWASVYEGVNARIGRRVAIKVLSDEAIQKVGVVDRFEREAQSATRIESDHVVSVFDLGVLGDGRPYIVMELLEGESLGSLITEKGTVSQNRAVFYVVQALRGLADAHGAGVMHRDIKPDNLVLIKTKHGEEILKIVDFGISKLQSGLHQVTNMTQTNTILGSPVYMSPEQCRGTRHMDHRSDLYSLGVVLFELLTGNLPHKGETFNELMFKIALEDTVSPAVYKPDLDPQLCDITLKALAREPGDRYQTATEFEEALIEWCKITGVDTETWSSRRSRLRIDDSEMVTVNATTKRASTPKPIELAETKQPTKPGTGSGGVVRLEAEARDDSGTSGKSSERMKAAAAIASTQESLKDSSDVAAKAVPAPKSEDAPESASPPAEITATGETTSAKTIPATSPKRPTWILAAVAAALVVGGLAFVISTSKNSDPNKTTTAGSGVPSAHSDPTPPPSSTAATVATPATASAEPTTTQEPSATAATPTAPATTVKLGGAVIPRKPNTATPPTTAATPSATAATPAASGSAKSVVDGRRIRENF